MPRCASRKTSANARIAKEFENRTDGRRKRQRIEATNIFQESACGSSRPQEELEIQFVHEEPFVTNIRNTEKLARQKLPLHFSMVHHLAPFNATCRKCSAEHWVEERTLTSSIKNPEFSTCCAGGKVSLRPPLSPPAELKKYLLDLTEGKCTQKSRKINLDIP
jgi:hypothetical protein